MSSQPLFSDRTEAGEKLANLIVDELAQLHSTGITAPPIVYALPRGGIPVAVPIARQLGCPVNILVAKKITKPHNPELAIGAVTADGQVLWLKENPFRKFQQHLQQEVLRHAQEKAQAQQAEFTPNCPQVSAEGAIAILVDDGIATGMTMAVAAQSVRSQNPAAVWVATPVAPDDVVQWLHQWCDRAIVLDTPDPFLSVSRFYTEFPQVETQVAKDYLQQHNASLLLQTSNLSEEE